jgi:hypothetical protein
MRSPNGKMTVTAHFIPTEFGVDLMVELEAMRNGRPLFKVVFDSLDDAVLVAGEFGWKGLITSAIRSAEELYVDVNAVELLRRPGERALESVMACVTTSVTNDTIITLWHYTSSNKIVRLVYDQVMQSYIYISASPGLMTDRDVLSRLVGTSGDDALVA